MTTSRNRRHSTLMPLVPLNTGSIMLLIVMLSIRLFACLSVCLSICHFTSRVRSISPSPVKAFLQLPDTKMICRVYRYHQICQRTSWSYFKVQDMVRRSAEKKNYNSTFTSDVAVSICSLHIERWNPLHISVTKCRSFCERLTECSPY